MKNSENVFDVTLDDDIWKDSFDRLLNKRSLLRELNVLKNNVRISFNNDSSVEVSEENISNERNLEEKVLQKRISGSISTPKFISKASGPFDCTISPISSWRLTNVNQKDAWDSSCKLISNVLDTVAESIEDSRASSTKGLKTNCNIIPTIQVIEDHETCKTQPIVNESSIHVSNTDDIDANLTVHLPPGKWRKSLSVWRRVNQPKNDCLDNCSKNYTNRFTLNRRHSRKTFSLIRKTISKNSTKRKGELELLRICQQSKSLSFSNVYSNSGLRNCRKIGEGTYGEVFANSEKNEQTVIKIIPIEGKIDVNGEPQKSFETVLPEIIITSELSKLRQTKSFATSGFVMLKNVRYLRGKYPDHLLELWNLYDQNYGSENDHPETFEDDQLYVSLEIGFGGKDLESYVFRNAEQAYSAFVQVTLSLAVAEQELEFEHRDLHCGNILIAPTNEKTVEYTINNKTVKVPTSGIKVTIIDYTLSRMLLSKCCYYNDLSTDEELFCAKGDYQYDIYRLMKEKLNNNWQLYEPQTNVYWLHYVLTKLFDCSKYKNYKSKHHKLYLDRLKTLKDSIMTCNSAFEISNLLQFKT